jgi:hypothetical protein
MLVRCPKCSVAREVEPEKGAAKRGVVGVCAHCGYGGSPADGPGASRAEADSAPSDSTSNFAGARAKLKTATQDLFRLSGNYSLPAEARAAEPVVVSMVPPDAGPGSGRKAEASIMFSLEELMKANPISPKRDDTADQQLWSMHSATPLFGTSHDQALLTTPLKLEQTASSSSMDTMTVPSQPPSARRFRSLVLVAGALCLLGAGYWASGQGKAPLAADSSKVSDPALLEPAQSLPVEAPLVAAAVVPATTADPAAPIPPAEAPPAAVPAADALPVPGAQATATPELPREKAAPRKSAPRATPPSSSPKAFPFDKAAAKNALNSAATAAADCGQGGAGGKGKMQLTFANTGRVTNVEIVEGPFAGTAAGKCALRQFRAARVPSFSGAPVTVSKSFKIP